MQTYIVSFAAVLILGIFMRLIHPESSELSTPPLVAAGFLLAGAVISFIYRSRVMAFLLLCAAICIFMLALPITTGLNMYLMGIFAALFLISIVFGFIKIRALPFWILSALVLGYGLTCLHLDRTSPSHVIYWGGDDNNTQSLVYGIIVKEPEVRPEKGDTRLTIESSIVAKIDKNPKGLSIIEQAIGEMNGLQREWETEEEALLTLLQVRDRLADDPEANPEEIIREEFSCGDYIPSKEDIETIQMSAEELGPPGPEKGWITRIDTGWILVIVYDRDLNRDKIYPAVSDWRAYGDTVRIIAPLQSPPPAENPGGFDYRSYLESVNTFATMQIKGKENWTTKQLDTIEIIKPSTGNFFINWCMGIKYELLAVIRQTTPFPESGFLSGIFVGLRQGVPDKIVKDSQAAGTAHVFAVSGLHVTIIAGLLLLIFNQTPIPKSVWAPIAVLFLLIFTVITGARPSTLRAATMNSFVLIFFTYFGKNIQKSLIMSICFAAIVIICFLPAGYGGPLILPSASFLMSFSAVLFLGLLSGPVEDFFNFKLNNLHSLVTFAAVAILAGLLFMNLGNPWGILKAKLFWGFLIAIPVSFLIQQVIPFRPRFSKIPGRWLRTFIAAQVAIQCSIVPLSMVIFHRMSLAAPFANFIAIPLIGIILPLGMLATLIGFIPLIGMPLALLITAANWLGMHFFIWMDNFFARTFPYPQVPKPGPIPLVIFYLVVFFFIYREKIILSLKIAFIRVKNSLPDSACRIRVYGALAALLIAIAATATGFISSRTPELKVIFLSMGWKDGMCALIEAPNGDTILIDGGAEGRDFYKKRYSYWNQGQRTLEEVLLSEKVVAFDAVVNSSPDARLLGGLNYIVGSDDYYIKRLYVSLPPSVFGPKDINLNRFAIALASGYQGDAGHYYRLLLLNQFKPEDALHFMTFFRKIPDDEITAALQTLPREPNPKYDPMTITGEAIQILKEKEAEGHEQLIESIISTEGWLHPDEDFTREQAEVLAKKWKLSVLTPDEYHGFVSNLPQPIQWFVYQQGGVLADMDELAAYRMELYDLFIEAIGFKSENPDDRLYRDDEMFLQYHRLLFSAKVQDIPVSPANQGIVIIEPEEIRTVETAEGEKKSLVLEAAVLNPPVDRVPGKYVNEVNSVVVYLRYGDVSFIFPSLLDNEGANTLAQNVKDGVAATIYQAPQFGKGSKYFDPTILLQLVKPEVAVFQYPGGSFGRPSTKFLEAWAFCQAQGIKSYNTKEMGAITVITNGETYDVITALEQAGEESGGETPEKSMEVGGGM
ncbi:MAG: ComEC/Rec2 family competence protein [PVC group bacterium]